MEAVSDIPWDVIQNRKPLPEHHSLRPPRYLERVQLANGLRYAVVNSSQTGCQEETSRSKVVDRIELGDGYLIRMLMVGRSRKGAMSLALVEKQVAVPQEKGPAAQHKIDYNIDSRLRELNGSYDYQLGDESDSVFFKLPRLEDGAGADRGKLTYQVAILDVPTQNQTNFFFNTDGQLIEIQMLGMGYVGTPDAKKELFVLTEEAQRGVISLVDDKLKGPLANILVQRWFGIQPVAGLTIDTANTLSLLIANIDSPSPKNPREVVKFLTHG